MSAVERGCDASPRFGAEPLPNQNLQRVNGTPYLSAAEKRSSGKLTKFPKVEVVTRTALQLFKRPRTWARTLSAVHFAWRLGCKDHNAERETHFCTLHWITL